MMMDRSTVSGEWPSYDGRDRTKSNFLSNCEYKRENRGEKRRESGQGEKHTMRTGAEWEQPSDVPGGEAKNGSN